MEQSRLAPSLEGSDEHVIIERDRRAGAVTPGSRSDALCEILSQLNRDAVPDDWARVVLPLLVAALGLDTGAILRVTAGSEAELLAAFGRTRKRGFPYPRVDLSDELLVPLTQRSRVVVVGAQTGTLQAPLRALCLPRFRVAVVASAFMGHTLGGLLVLSGRRDRVLTADDRAFLSAVADAVGLALGTAALSRQSHLSEVVLETAGAVARAISGSLDLAQTFRQIAHSAARVMGDCNCLLLAVEDGGDGDLVAVACSDPADDVLLGLQVRFTNAAGEREALARRRRSIVVEDLVWGAGTERAYRERLDMRSALFVPIHSEDGLIGSLLLYSTARRDRYSERDIARAETVAEQAAGAICNARLYRDLERSESRAKALLERITRLRERQRLTFADVLHDDIVQTVVAALFQVEGLRAASGDESREELDRVAAMLKQTITDARGVIWDLRPPVLDGLGLDGAFSALAARVSGDGGFEVRTDLVEVPDLPPRISTTLYVIAREALQNTRKHANARRATLAVRSTDDGAEGRRVTLTVADDGVGFDSDAVRAADHFGLTMMDEQAALAGGSLTVSDRPGGGTIVEATVPYTDRGES